MIKPQEIKLGVARLFCFQHNLKLGSLLADKICGPFDDGVHFGGGGLRGEKKLRSSFTAAVLLSVQASLPPPFFSSLHAVANYLNTGSSFPSFVTPKRKSDVNLYVPPTAVMQGNAEILQQNW